MLSSKANAALTRLREIEEKYRMKRKQQNWKREEDSSISSVSIDLPENISAKLMKESPRNVSKLKLDIRMPDTRISDERVMSSKVTLKPLGDKADPAVSLEGKLQEEKGKEQKSSSSDVTTIQEYSSVNSASVGSINSSSKSLLRSKTLRQDANNKVPGREGRTKVTARADRGRTSDKSSEIAGRRTSLDNSSTTKGSRVSKKSNDVPKLPPSDLKSQERSFRTEAIAEKRTGMVDLSHKSWHSSRTESLSNNSVIEESIDTVMDDSEIISELSRVDESLAVKVESSMNANENSGHSQVGDDSATIVGSSRYLVAENSYANDSFEDVSSSIARSKSTLQEEKIVDETDDDSKGEKVMDLMAPESSVTEMDLGSVSHVSDMERTGANPCNGTMHLIKSSSSIDTSPGKRKERSQRAEFEGSVASHKSTSSISNLSTSDVTQTDAKVVSLGRSPTKVASASGTDRQDSDQESRRKTSDETGKRTSVNVTESTSSGSSKGLEEGSKDALDENTKKQTSQDAENALRELHRDVIETLTKRQASSETAREASEDSPGSKAELEVRNSATTSKKITAKAGDKTHRSSARNREIERNNNSDRERSGTKRRKARAKVTNSRSVKAHGDAGSRKEGKALDLDEKQMRVLRKRIVELRLRQEREDLQKYTRELKDLKLESSSTPSYFSPLEFPKIAEFTFDATDSESKPDDRIVFQERVSAIRRWLKDQYILYRDYCTMAQAINAHYVPTTLEGAKKVTRSLK